MTTLILLAAGRGSRLKNLTEDLPKCLNTYHGNSLMQHILDVASIFKKDITQIVIISGYRGHLLGKFGYKILENRKWNTSGPFQSLLLAQKYLESTPCIVSYTDIIYGEEFLESCLTSAASIFLPSNANFKESWKGREVEILEDLESFVLAENKLIEIGNRPKTLDEIQGQFAGIFKTFPEGWQALVEVTKGINSQMLDMTGLFSLAIRNGVSIECQQIRSNWKEFDLPSDFDE
jgi:choline kinase